MAIWGGDSRKVELSPSKSATRQSVYPKLCNDVQTSLGWEFCIVPLPPSQDLTNTRDWTIATDRVSNDVETSLEKIRNSTCPAPLLLPWKPSTNINNQKQQIKYQQSRISRTDRLIRSWVLHQKAGCLYLYFENKNVCKETKPPHEKLISQQEVPSLNPFCKRFPLCICPVQRRPIGTRSWNSN